MKVSPVEPLFSNWSFFWRCGLGYWCRKDPPRCQASELINWEVCWVSQHIVYPSIPLALHKVH